MPRVFDRDRRSRAEKHVAIERKRITLRTFDGAASTALRSISSRMRHI
jgi:hypothetical protein